MNKRILTFSVICILLLLWTHALSEDSNRVFDNAKLLSQEEKMTVNSAIKNFQAETGMDFVLLTNQQSHEGVTQKEIADNYYNDGSFGFDNTHSGILMLIDMAENQLYLSTTGDMIEVLDNTRLDIVLDSVTVALTKGEYQTAIINGIKAIKLYTILGKRTITKSSTEIAHPIVYIGLDDILYTTALNFSDAYFQNSSTYMNPQLASASIALSAAAYIKPSISEALECLGFLNIEQHNYTTAKSDTEDTVAVTFGRKVITVNDTPQDLFAIVFRGTHSVADWVSNFNITTGDTHAGFLMAEQNVLSHFRDYCATLESSGAIDKNRKNNLLWITGHSRGAAIANLFAADINKYFTYATTDHLYAYTFACPNVTTVLDPVGNHPNIFNFNNGADFITSVPLAEWGYSRHGSTILLDDSQSRIELMMEAFKRETGMDYQGSSRDENESLVNDIIKIAPSVKAYYSVNIRSHDFIVPFFTVQTPAVLFTGIAYGLGGDYLNAAKYIGADLIGLDTFFDVLKTSAHRITSYFISGSRLLPNIPQAHSLESYICWMEVLAAEQSAQVGSIQSNNSPKEDVSISSESDETIYLMQQLLGMPASDAAILLGGDFSYDSTGAEGSLDGYYFPDHGFTLSYYGDPESAQVTSIYCWKGTSIGAVTVGMSTNEITGIIGSPIEVVPGDEEDYPYDVYCYQYDDLRLEFIQTDGKNDPTFYAIVSHFDSVFSEEPAGSSSVLIDGDNAADSFTEKAAPDAWDKNNIDLEKIKNVLSMSRSAARHALGDDAIYNNTDGGLWNPTQALTAWFDGPDCYCVAATGFGTDPAPDRCTKLKVSQSGIMNAKEWDQCQGKHSRWSRSSSSYGRSRFYAGRARQSPRQCGKAISRNKPTIGGVSNMAG